MLLTILANVVQVAPVVPPIPPIPPSVGMGKEISNYDEIEWKRKQQQNNLVIAICKVYIECRI